MPDDPIIVEVAYAKPEEQVILEVQGRIGMTLIEKFAGKISSCRRP